MQQLERYKTQKLSQFSQLIILDDQGNIVESCDSIFSTQHYKSQPFPHYFPFLESIYDLLKELKVNGEEMKYAKIEAPLKELPGVYDFTFSRVLLDQQEYILWSIFDYTEVYEDFKQYQQKRNELEIHREMLESRNRNLHHQKDLLAQKNLALQNWDEVRKDYYDKVRMALQSPVNALDGLSFILANITKDADEDYISALRAAVQNLQEVLAEFDIVSSIDGNNQFSEIKTFDLRQVIDATTQNFFSTIPDQTFQLSVHFAPNLPRHILGNPIHLQQILHHLLANAQKFNARSNLNFSVKGQAISDDKWSIQFEILENTTDDLHSEKIAAPNNSPDATQLIFRLSLVKKLIELEGGNISVKSQGASNGFSITCQLYYPEVN